MEPYNQIENEKNGDSLQERSPFHYIWDYGYFFLFAWKNCLKLSGDSPA